MHAFMTGTAAIAIPRTEACRLRASKPTGVDCTHRRLRACLECPVTLQCVTQDADDKRKKAIKKAVDKEEKTRAPVVKKAAQSPTYLEDLQAMVQRLREQVAALNATLT
jgi:septal ring factor EnvC (AmiA/AmiB activator)